MQADLPLPSAWKEQLTIADYGASYGRIFKTIKNSLDFPSEETEICVAQMTRHWVLHGLASWWDEMLGDCLWPKTTSCHGAAESQVSLLTSCRLGHVCIPGAAYQAGEAEGAWAR